MSKTIFITSFHPLISRNILATGLLGVISRSNKVVLFVPDFKTKYFNEQFGGENIIVEGVDMALGFRDLFFRSLALAITDTNDLYIKRRARLHESKKFLRFLVSIFIARVAGGSSFVLRLVRFLDLALPAPTAFEPFFKKYKPDLVFATDVQNELDVRILQEAKKARVKTLGMVRSWDNLTSKGILRVLPDELVVHNETVKLEAIKYNFISPQKIKIVGIPHYDKYVLPPRISKQEFFKRFGFDLSKKLILYAPIGDRYIRDNQTDKYALETLSSLEANILVRLPPTDTVSGLEDFSAIGGPASGGRKTIVALDKTGFGFEGGGKKQSEISPEDDQWLASSLYFCDVLVTGQSTIVIDAAVFDKPAVIVNFDAEARPYWDSISRYYDYEYYKKFRERTGIRLARNAEELLALARKYLQNPELDMEVRKKIIEDQVGLFDGRASKRLADVLLSRL